MRKLRLLCLLIALPLGLLALWGYASTPDSAGAEKPVMRRLVLIRHAKAADASPGMSDFERPLEQRGIDDANALRHWLDSEGICKDRIMYSPSVRTVQTLELLFGQELTQGEVRVPDSSLYLAAPEDYLNVLSSTPDEVKCLVVIGHNPSTTMVVNQLQRDKTYDEVPTCGINVVSMKLDHWADIRSAKGKLEAWMTPNRYRDR